MHSAVDVKKKKKKNRDMCAGLSRIRLLKSLNRFEAINIVLRRFSSLLINCRLQAGCVAISASGKTTCRAGDYRGGVAAVTPRHFT